MPLFAGVKGFVTTEDADPSAALGRAAPTVGAAPANADTPPVTARFAPVIAETPDMPELTGFIPSLTAPGTATFVCADCAGSIPDMLIESGTLE